MIKINASSGKCYVLVNTAQCWCSVLGNTALVCVWWCSVLGNAALVCAVVVQCFRQYNTVRAVLVLCNTVHCDAQLFPLSGLISKVVASQVEGCTVDSRFTRL